MSKFDFLNALERNTNLTYTENGALTNKSSLNACLDLFSLAGAMRNRSEEDITRLLDLAIAEDPLTALKYVFYNGDIRCGLGERRTFRIMLKHLANNYPEYLKANIHLIPHYNRWDSLYVLDETTLERSAYDLIKAQLEEDLTKDAPSLCAKWLASTNASSKETKRLAKKTSLALNLCNFTGDITKKTIYKNEEKYRKTLSELRSKINIVEKQMSNSEFSNIDYSHVPSNAMNKYTKAFYRRDNERFETFINNALLDKAKLNSKTLYPYEIVHKILNGKTKKDIEKTIAELQWNGLPDYVEGKDLKGICVVDTSASMWGKPMEVAISLGLYCAERCTGAFKDKFITFSSRPRLVDMSNAKTLHDRLEIISHYNECSNTNLEATMDLILNTAIKNKTPQKDIPNILILSDMNFDSMVDCGRNGAKTLMENIEAKWNKAGYRLPRITYWNIIGGCGRQAPVPVQKSEAGIALVSGFSPAIASMVYSSKTDPYEVLVEKLESPRYASVFKALN